MRRLVRWQAKETSLMRSLSTKLHYALHPVCLSVRLSRIFSELEKGYRKPKILDGFRTACTWWTGFEGQQSMSQRHFIAARQRVPL